MNDQKVSKTGFLAAFHHFPHVLRSRTRRPPSKPPKWPVGRLTPRRWGRWKKAMGHSMHDLFIYIFYIWVVSGSIVEIL